MQQLIANQPPFGIHSFRRHLCAYFLKYKRKLPLSYQNTSRPLTMCQVMGWVLSRRSPTTPILRGVTPGNRAFGSLDGRHTSSLRALSVQNTLPVSHPGIYLGWNVYVHSVGSGAGSHGFESRSDHRRAARTWAYHLPAASVSSSLKREKLWKQPQGCFRKVQTNLMKPKGLQQCILPPFLPSSLPPSSIPSFLPPLPFFRPFYFWL